MRSTVCEKASLKELRIEILDDENKMIGNYRNTMPQFFRKKSVKPMVYELLKKNVTVI